MLDLGIYFGLFVLKVCFFLLIMLYLLLLKFYLVNLDFFSLVFYE